MADADRSANHGPLPDLAEAERRVEALRAGVATGETVAALRVRRTVPELAAGAGIDTAQAQHVVAREAGFPDWTSLCKTVEPARLDREGAETALAAALLAGSASRASAITRRWPGLAEESPACSLALPTAGAARRFDADTVNVPLPPVGLTPLLTLCASRHRAGDPAADLVRAAIAKDLVALGADVNAGMREADTIRGYRTVLGAAVDCARSPALAKLLLDSGADAADGPTLYEGGAMWSAVRHRDVASLKALLAAKPPQWHVCHALPHALGFDDVGLARLLLEAGGDPNWTMGAWSCKGTCLHEAAMLDNDPAIVRALLAHGAKVDAVDRDGRTPLAIATCLGRDAVAAVLREHGASEDRVRDVDRWVGACFAGDAKRARRLAEDQVRQPAVGLARGVASDAQRPDARTDLASCFRTADHLWVCRAVGRSAAPAALRTSCNNALPLLLDGGLDADAVDDDGETALHLAAAGNGEAVAVLLAHGANTRAENFKGETPLATAVAAGHAAAAQLLAEADADALTPLPEADFAAAFEAAADAVAAGDLETLDAAIRERPALAKARSPRPHRCALLHYLGANGFEDWRQRTPANAVAVVDRLIAAGADPNAVCYTYRGGPGEHVVGLLTTSHHPKEAGLTLPLLAALAQGGARLDPVHQLLASLHRAAKAAELSAAVRQLDPSAPASGLAVVECAALGETALLLALLDAGVPVDAHRDDGATALHQAAIGGDAALADLLLARGADPRLRDNVFDGTPAGWADAGGHADLARRLAEAAG